jgi:hypothetical protein
MGEPVTSGYVFLERQVKTTTPHHTIKAEFGDIAMARLLAGQSVGAEINQNPG